jgi:hypothetical protein
MKSEKPERGKMRRDKFRAGDSVIVCSAQEILSTLDANGSLDGLPFMPEMLDWCGKPFRVLRRVEKTCVDIGFPTYPNRRFAADDVVMLEGPRCDGHGHDGCKRGCRIFWKEAWLRRAEGAPTPTPPPTQTPTQTPAPPPAPMAEAGLAELSARLKVRADEQRYFCQSTELKNATEPFPGKTRPWMVRIAFKQIRNGDRSARDLAKRFVIWFVTKLRRITYGDKLLRGPNKTTPAASLDLKPGELVRVKRLNEIVATLDQKGRNRGMHICYEMTRCCGEEAEVRIRVDRIIDERTGTMRKLQNTVMLRNMRSDPNLCEECLCYEEMGDCPRGELMYWREIWLERTPAAGS